MEKSKLRLLVVEDEKKLCDMIAKSLHLAGYEVDICNDGEQALEMIYAELYDLIVLDLNLPGVDGMEILRELRKENEETKVLIRLPEARSQIRLRAWIPVQMIIWKNHFTCRSWKRA